MKSNDAESVDKEKLILGRKKFFPSSLSVSHSRVSPLVVVRGEKEFLYDECGNEYLDTRNNVPILGHSDKGVADAIADQMRAINTNTRYLHPKQVEAAELLSTILPAKLCKFFFVNSGSEANDLALRLARYHTGNKHVVAQTRAYHGNTTAVMEVSECKFKNPHCVKEDWVSVVHAPSGLVGEDGEASIEDVKRVCDEFNGGIAAIILESVISVGGGIFQPPGYVAEAFSLIRKAGGVCISDETQVGLGRLGRGVWWGFQLDGSDEAVPDIVTIGKQLGNGFPVAAVVCTEEICQSFENAGIEFFSTYGGSTASCAAIIATLDILMHTDLLQRADKVGEYLISLLHAKLDKFIPTLIRDIRGRGLYLAVEFPTTEIARTVHDWLYRDHRILSTLDGPEDNVMIIKPPLCFSHTSCELFVDALVQILNTM